METIDNLSSANNSPLCEGGRGCSIGHAIPFGRNIPLAPFARGIRLIYSELLIAIHASAHFLDMVASDIFVVLHHLVDDAVRSEFDDTVGHGLDELVVVRSEEHITLIELQVIVECLDRFEVEVVGRRIENQAIGIAELHAGNHTTHFLAP